MPSLGFAIFELRTDAKQFHSGLSAAEAAANRSAASIGAKLQSVGKSTAAVGGTLTRRLTAPLVLAGGVAVKMSLDFDKSLTNISALVGASTKDVSSYRSTILRMAKDGKGSANELAQALYFITSSGFSGAKALRVLDATAKASEAGLGDMSQVAQVVTSAVTVYGEKNLSAARATDILTAAVREGKAEPAEFAGSMGQLIPVAEKSGVAFGEASGALAALTLGGLDGAKATTALRAALLASYKPTVQAKDALREIGMSSQEFRDLIAKKGVLPAIDQVSKAFKGNSEAMGAVFGNVRGLVGALSLTGKNSAKNAKLIDRVSKSAGDANVAFDKAAKSEQKRLQDARNRLGATMIEIGDTLTPILVTVAEAVGRVFDAFDKLPKPVKATILVVLGIVAVLGPLITLVGNLTVAVGFLAANPIVLVIAALVALGIAIVVAYRHFEGFRRVVDQVIQFARGVITTGLNYLRGLWVKHAAEVKATWESIKRIVQVVVYAVKAIWDKFGAQITAVVKAVWERVKIQITTALNVIKNVILAVMALIRGDWGKAWEYIKAAAGAAISGAVALVKSTLTNLVPAVLGLALSVGKAILSGIGNGLANLVSFLFEKVKSGVGTAVARLYGAVRDLAVNVGKAIINGILSGLGGLFGAIKDKIFGGISGAFGWVGDKLHGSGPFMFTKQMVGMPLAQGVIDGWVYGSASLPEKMKEGLKNAIEAARRAVDAARGRLSAAFSTLASDALKAFDAKTQQGLAKLEQRIRSKYKGALSLEEVALTPTEAIIAKMEDERQSKDLDQAIKDARAELMQAQAPLNMDKVASISDTEVGNDLIPTPEEIAIAAKERDAAIFAAKKTLDDALYQKQLVALQRKAAQERLAEQARVVENQRQYEAELAAAQLQYQAARDLERRHFEEQLTALATSLSNRGIKADQANKQLIKLMRSYGVDMRDAGRLLGDSFADGLDQMRGRVTHSAQALANILARYLRLHSPAEEGPLSDLDTWWKTMPRTLVASIDTRMIADASARIASAVRTSADGAPLAAAATTPGAGGPLVGVYGDLVVREEEDADKVAGLLSRKVATGRTA